ncbi:hypothetical protein ScPMuIL_008513 [Solemya velum]
METTVSFKLLSLYLLLLAVGINGDEDWGDYYDTEEYESERKPKGKVLDPCKSNGHVCTSLMQYADGQVFNEGPYCTCKGCTTEWKKGDSNTMTWTYHEQVDKTVQYHFCIPIMPERVCSSEEIAITMVTEVSGWNVHMREARCKCEDDVFKLDGWWRKNNLWFYEYVCHKNKCSSDALCAKIYVDEEDKMTLGYEFMCTCPLDQKCPTDRNEEKRSRKDKKGKYIPKFCEPIFRRK